MAPRWLCLCKCSGPYVGLITNGVLPTVNELVLHWMLHPHPISLVSWSSCSQSLEHDSASVTNLNGAICNICYPGTEAVHVYYVTLYKHHVVWYGVVWCGVVWCGVVWCGVVWHGVVWCGVAWCGVPCLHSLACS